MDKKVALIIVFFLAVFIAIRLSIAFNYMNSEKSDPYPAELPASYSGYLPCADCPGISYYLDIDQDGFTETSFYEDRNAEPIIKKGEWRVKDDTLTIYKNDEDFKKRFIIDHPELTLLDRSGNRITGELQDQYRLSQNPEDESIRNHHKSLKDEGYIFTASGNEPFWSVRLNNEQVVTFRTPGESESFSEAELTRQNSEALIVSDDLSVNIRSQFCRDTMSGFLFSHTVDVKFGEFSYSGCGTFLE